MNSAADKREFVITRTFNAPRQLVWDAWTQVEHLQKWFGPTGSKITTAKMDFRPGGTFLYALTMPNGLEMWGKWTFQEIVVPERIVLIQCFSDKDGGITRHPMAPEWPKETHSATTFTAQGNQTLITLRWSPYNATDSERAIFDASHASMNQGWGGTFAQLDAYLAGFGQEKK